MNWISLCLLIFMTTVTGSIVFCLWRFGIHVLEKHGKMGGSRAALIFSAVSFFIPFLFFYKAYQLRLFLDGNTGPLFWDTPILMLLGKVLFFLWAGGALCRIIQMRRNRKPLQELLRTGRRAGGEIQETADRIQKQLHIRSRIFVYLTDEEIGPMIVGMFNSRIFLPQKNYGEKELEIILEHELWHYKQGDLALKGLCGWISKIHWFNPLVRELGQEVSRWGEIHCDLHLCYKKMHSWDRKQYFLTILENAPEQEPASFSGIGLGKTAKEIKRRMEKMKKYDPRKEWNKAVVTLVILCFVLVASVTSLAAGELVEDLYGVVYDATEVIELEELQLQPEVSDEYEWVPGNEVTIIESEENLNARGFSNYNWTIPADSIKKTGSFYVVSGSKITLTITPDPIGAATGIGLDQPNGRLRGVSGSGSYSHTFTINESGYYKAYVRNEEGSQIEVMVTLKK